MTNDRVDTLCINTIRTLFMDAVQEARSGHPGTPMAMAPVVYTLWQRHLRFDTEDPIWPNRDRFVLSIGHASMLLYSLLHLTDVKAVNARYEKLGQPSVTLDDIEHFRQLDSKCPGHPEYRWTSGVETTTGPLGQGVATSVGMAIAGLRDRAKLVHEQSRGRPVYFTEWNITSNPRDHYHDEPFAAAYAAKIVMETDAFVEGYSYWTFTDIFEENYFPSMPFHGGFGLLNLYGVPKPIYRAFQLLHGLGRERLPVVGTHETVDAWVVRKGRSITVLLTNHAQPRHDIVTQLVEVRLTDAPAPLAAYIERIDEDHANPRRRWREMGEPEYLSRAQVEPLEAASRLVQEPLDFSYENRTVRFDADLPPHAVAAVTLDLAAEPSDGSAAA